jgi:hypothetical protein
MRFLRCKICGGEIDIIDDYEHSTHKKVKCRCCLFSNTENQNCSTTFSQPKYPDVICIKRRLS